MAQYRFWAFDLVSKQPFGQLPLVEAQLTTLINTPGAFQANLYPQQIFPEQWGIGTYEDAQNDPRALARLNWLQQAIECGKTLVIAEYDNTIAGSAIIWQWTYNSEQGGDSNTAAYYQLQGSETISYLQQRNYRGNTGAGTDAINSGFPSDLTTGTDQVSGTLKYILQYAQNNYGNIGIGYDNLTPSGVSNQESYDPTKRDSLFTLLQNLSQTIDGPDFWVDTQWVGNTKSPKLEAVGGYPKIGARWDGTQSGLRNVPHYSFPGEILYYTLNRNGLNNFSICDEMSRDQTGVTDIATATNPGLNQYGKWPQLDFVNNRDGGDAQAISIPTLQAYANADAQQYNGPLELATVTIRPEAVAGRLYPGDDAWLTLNDWSHPGGSSRVQRCLGVQYNFDEQTAVIQIDTSDSVPVGNQLQTS